MNKRHGSRPTDGFRSEHAKIHEHLSQIQNWTGALLQQSADEQIKTMEKIVSFFDSKIKSHAAWEEESLYPLVDKIASPSNNSFTSSMRHEHKIISRWIDELNEEMHSEGPNALAFTRATDQLLGLIKAHFEEEEEVLLPFIDNSMTAQEFKDEIQGTLHH